MLFTRIFSIAFLAGGVLLLIFGIDAWNSAGSEISRVFQGGPSNRAIWLLVTGIISLFLGIGGLFYTPKAGTH
ncbi:MAG TPA: DUF3185 family protein [Chitinispirillaceae bacterium]|nr:DUF3185 family protein [Chitinispirillaceae bacterium]